MSSHPARNVYADIVGQHCEEAAFLWFLREGAVGAPHYNLKDLAELDGRVEAHIDGLRVAGEAGWRLCEEGVGSGEGGVAFAAGVLALEGASEGRLRVVLDAVVASPKASRGLVSAFGWSALERVAWSVEECLAAEAPEIRLVGTAASAIHRRDPGRALTGAVSGGGSALRARALKAIGEIGRIQDLPLLREHFAVEDEEVHFWAGWSATLLGDDSATQVLKGVAESGGPRRDRAGQLAVRRMGTAEAVAWIERLQRVPGGERLSVQAAGALGEPDLVPWLLEQMRVPAFARVAGEAFEFVTGADIAYEDLDGEMPEGFEAGPTEDPKDENVEMDPDENLPWPDPAKVEAWWKSRAGEFPRGVRRLLGKPLTNEWLQHVLREGRQRQRAAAALELAIQNPGQPLFEVRAPGFRQQQLLGVRR